jgi:putative hydrolase of the HAD superfamily
MSRIQFVVFDWGDTLMRDLPEFAGHGAMVYWPRVELCPGAVEALRAMHGRRVCCVASNAGDSDAYLMGLALERVGISHFFDHLWTSKELGAAKPDPAFFEAILDRLQAEPRACVMVGNDYQKDIVSAKSAGLWTVWLAPASAVTAAAADAIIHSLADLDTAIARLVAGPEALQ